MAIFKEKIRNQYFRMPVEYVRNKGFTLKEIGLLALLCSLPETWKFSLEGLTRIVNEGIDSIRATYKKLNKKGFVNAPRVRGPDGKFACSDLFMHISPEAENDPYAEKPHMENPMTDKPPVDKPSPGRPRAGYRRESKSKESILKESKNNRFMNQGYNSSQRGRKNSFNNFPQRDYDWDTLERDLLRSQSMTGGEDVCAN